MKKLLVLAALTMAAAPAMASKARLNALGNASHLVDTQTLFVNPADLNYVGDFATLEFGNNTPATGEAKAEGGFVRNTSWGKVGAYLGHRNDVTTDFISLYNAKNALNSTATGQLLSEQNPLDLFYGNEFSGMKYGVDLHYSNSKNDTGATSVVQKQNTLGLSAGVRTDIWNAYLRLGLSGKTESDVAASPKLESKGLYKAGGGYWFDSIYAFANYEYAKGTGTTSSVDTDITKNQYEVGMVNNHKLDAGTFFYGVSYLSNEVKYDKSGSPTAKISQNVIPLVVGMEMDATSWMVLRGSVKQSVLVGDKKDEVGTTGTIVNKSQLVNDTVVAAGAGLKFGKLTVDSTISAATSGRFMTDNAGNGTTNSELLANMSMTYLF